MSSIEFRFIMRTLLWIAKWLAGQRPATKEIQNIEKDYNAYVQNQKVH